MKLTKISLVAAAVLGGLIAFSNMAIAQDTGKDAGKDAKKGKGARMTIEQQMEKWTKDLDLKDDQKPKFKEALEDSQKKMRELRQDSSLDRAQQREKMQTIIQDQDKAIKKILTDDQYKKYEEKMKEDRKKKKGGFGGGKKSDSETKSN